jgi:trimeric autotransporter adhesin
VVFVAGLALTNATGIAAGMNHSLAVLSDGTVVGWGLNSSGQSTGSVSFNPDRATGVVKVDGQVLSNVVAVAAGWGQSQAVKSDGSPAAWGTGFDGARIGVPTWLGDVVSVAGWSSLAAKSDGKIVNILDGHTLNGISNIVAVSAPKSPRKSHLIVLQRDGVVLQVRLTSPPSTSFVVSNATAIAAGGLNNLALKRDGTVFAWGGDSRVPPGLSNVVAISAGQSHSLALKNDGTVVAWGATDRPAASVPAGLSNVVAIAAGNDFSLVITTNAAVAERFRR